MNVILQTFFATLKRANQKTRNVTLKLRINNLYLIPLSYTLLNNLYLIPLSYTMFLIVVLQAVVYSLLLLFIHPRPEPRTQSLIETVMSTLVLVVYIIQLSPEGEVNSGGYIPRREASRYISIALHRP